MKTHRIQSARHLSGFILRLKFADGSEFDLDLEPMVSNAQDELTAPLRNPKFFAAVACNGLTIEWPNGLDICPDALRAWCEAGRVLPECEPSAIA